MADEIRQDEVYQRNLFTNLTGSAKKSEKQLTGMIEVLDGVIASLAKLNATIGADAGKLSSVFLSPKDIDNLKKLLKLQERQTTVTTELTAAQRQRQQTQRQLNTETARAVTNRSREFREVQRLREQNRQFVRGIRDEIRQRGINSNSIQALTNRTRQLVSERAALDRSTRQGRQQFAQLTREIVGNTEELRRYDAQIGRTRGGLQSLQGGFRGLTRALGIFGVSLGAGALIKSAIDEFKEFEITLTNVLTLLSESQREEFGLELKEGALELIRKYGFSIQDVNKALFDTVSAGVPASEAIKFLDTAGAKLAKGGAADLGVAVDAITTGINAFGLKTKDAEIVANAFFAAQKGGKTTVDELAASFAQAAPTANVLGLNIGELAGQVQILTLKGVPTAQAFTQISAVMNTLNAATPAQAKAFNKLGISTGAAGVKAQGFANIMEILNQKASENPDILAKVFTSSEALKGVQVLLGESYNDLTEAIRTINEDIGENSSLSLAAAVVAETQADRSKRLTGEFTAMSIALGEKLLPILNNIKQAFLDFTKFLIKNGDTVKKVTKFVAAAAAGWVFFRLAVKLFGVQITKLKLSGITFGLKRMLVGIKSAAAGFRTGSFSVKAFGTALKNIPILGWISALVTAISVLALFESSADQAAVAQERFNKGLETGKANAEEFVNEQQKLIAQRLEGLKQEGEQRKALGEDAAKVDQEIRDAEIQQLEQANAANKRVIDKKHAATIESAEAAKAELLKINQEIADAESGFIGRTTAGSLLAANLKNQRLQIVKNLKFIEGQFVGDAKAREKIIEQNGERIKALVSESNVAQINSHKGLTDAQKKEIERRNKLILAFEKQIRNVRNSLIEDDQRREIAARESANADLVAAAKVKAGNDRKLLEEFSVLEQLLEEKKLKEIQKIRDKFADKREKQDKKTRDLIAGQVKDDDQRAIVQLQNKHTDELDQLQTARDKQSLTEEQFGNQRLLILQRQADQTEELENRIRVSGFDEKSAEEDLKIQQEFSEMEFDNLKAFTDAKQELEDLALDKDVQRAEKRLELLRITNAAEQDIRAAELDLANLRLEQQERALTSEQELEDQRIENAKASQEAFIALADEAADFAKEQFQKQIDAIDELIGQSQDRLKRLESEAAAGTAGASIAAEEKKIAELQAEKEKRQKRQANIEQALVALKLLSANIEAGGEGGTGAALSTTLTQMATILGFIKSLPSFYEGTEHVGKSNAGHKMPGVSRDAHIIRADGTERIFTGSQNKRIGNISNEEATQAIEMYRYSVPAEYAVHKELSTAVIQPSYTVSHTNPELLSQMKAMNAGIAQNTKAIENIPQIYMGWEEEGFQKYITETIKREHKIVKNMYKFGSFPAMRRWAKKKGFRE